MKAILELKKTREDSIFYRYNIDGTLVWFEQYKENGHIYTVSVTSGDEIKERFRFYVQDGAHTEHYYPVFVKIETNHEGLTVDQVDGYVSDLVYAKMVAKAIMEIFESGEHKDLYEQFHKEEVK